MSRTPSCHSDVLPGPLGAVDDAQTLGAAPRCGHAGCSHGGGMMRWEMQHKAPVQHSSTMFNHIILVIYIVQHSLP